MKEMVAAYQSARPDVDVRPLTLSWGSPYYTKLSLASLGGEPPSVAIAHISRLPTLARAGLVRELTTPMLAPAHLTADRFNARPWERAHIDGRLYGLPLDTHPFVMYYRTDLCRKAGLLDGDGRLKPIEGPQALIGVLAALRKVTGAWGGVMSVTADPSTCWRMFWSLYRQLDPTPAGEAFLADGGTRITMDDRRAEEALQFMHRLTTTEKVLPPSVDSTGAIALFTSGKAGVLFDGVWQLPNIQGSKVPFDMAPLPRVFTDAPYACHADSHLLVLPSGGHSTPAHDGVCLDFARGLIERSLVWAGGGHIPSWRPTLESRAYRDLTPQAHYAAAAAGAVYDPDAWYSGAGSSLETRLGGIIAGVLTGSSAPRAATHRLRSALTDLTNTPAPV
ncbi:extracellular solute-binding protein [Streptomyces misionensis]|uniref:extracellular solute-binding protein n=1 Tax=Streptomyces misionensis TaxID=67331 RepID=UPI0033FD89BD